MCVCVCFSNAGHVWPFSNSSQEEQFRRWALITQRKVTKCSCAGDIEVADVGLPWNIFSVSSSACVGGTRGEDMSAQGKQEGRCTEARGYKEMEPDIVAGCLLSG